MRRATNASTYRRPDWLRRRIDRGDPLSARMCVRRQTIRVLSMMVLMTLLGAPAVLPGQTRDKNWKQCKSDDPERSVKACSALIQSGQEKGINLAKAFCGRGLAYARKGEYDHAIQDYDEALRINPTYVAAFSNRGIAYAHKGDYDRGIQDLDQALRLKPNDASA